MRMIFPTRFCFYLMLPLLAGCSTIDNPQTHVWQDPQLFTHHVSHVPSADIDD